MVSPSTQRRAAERIAQACRAGGDARSLRRTLLERIRPVVPFDGHVWLLTDPETEVGSAPVASLPFVADEELPLVIRTRYLAAANRWTTLAGAASLAATEPSAWSALLAGRGVGDVASVVFRDRHGCWGFLDLWRAAPGTFDAAEVELLAAIAPDVASALRRSQAATFASPVGARALGGPAVLVLSDELEVRARTARTDDYLRVLVPPPPARDPIPAAAYNVAAQLLAVEAGADGHAPWARVNLAGGDWLTLRASRLEPTGHAGGGEIAVTLEPTAPLDRVDLYGRACALSRREAELVRELASGLDTTSAARALGISEHTIHDHLRSVFAKTGVHTRAALLARALGTHD